MRAHLLFDLDGCLVDTECTEAYRGSHAGREHVRANIADFDTKVYDPELVKLVESYHADEKITVVTNSPRGYARAVLNKHGFPVDVPIVGSAGKPLPGRVREEMRMNRGNKFLMIGDSARDIIAAHECEIPAIAVGWGYDSTRKQLKAAEPRMKATTPDELEDKIIKFEQGKRKYRPREAPDKFDFLPEEADDDPDPEITILYGNDYVPWNRGGSREQFTKDMLTFKRTKDIRLDELNKDTRETYFWGGSLRNGQSYKGNFKYMCRVARRALTQGDLEGTTVIVAAPNSFPEYCYRMDTNHLLVGNLDNFSEGAGFDIVRTRVLYRVYPKAEDHSNGRSQRKTQYETIGVRNVEALLEYDNVVIFDDVTTHGTQLRTAAKILRHFGVSNNIYGLALGKTID